MRNADLIQAISLQIAVIQNDIAQNVASGYHDVYKTSENFAARLLNLTYGYSLVNLDWTGPAIPGLDIGDTAMGIAYQIAAKKQRKDQRRYPEISGLSALSAVSELQCFCTKQQTKMQVPVQY